MIEQKDVQSILDQIEKSVREILRPYEMNVQLHNVHYSGSSFVVTVQGVEKNTEPTQDLDRKLYEQVADITGMDKNLYGKVVLLNRIPYLVKGVTINAQNVLIEDMRSHDLVKITIGDFKRYAKEMEE